MQHKTIELKDCLKTYTTDQDKAIRPEDTVSRFKKRLEEVDLDILKEVKRIDNGRLGIPVFFSVCGEDARAMTGTKKQMGKGSSAIQAEASACMELGERFSFFTFKDNPENFITGDYAEMIEQGYPVMGLDQLLKSVHDEIHNEAFLQDLLDGIPMQWTWATNLGSREDVLIPFSWFYTINEFNGPSAGNTTEEAALQGICEIVERDVCARVSRDKLQTPTIDVTSINDPIARELLEKFKAQKIDLYLNDFSLDTGICTVAATAIDRSTFPETSEIVYTAGTTPDPEKAIIRAVTEVAQLSGDFNTGSNYLASGLPKPLSLEAISFVIDSDQDVKVDGMARLSNENIRLEVEKCVEELGRKDRQVFMIDTTHPELQIPAIYTIVPGAHFRERSMVADVGLFAAKLVFQLVDDPRQLDTWLQNLDKKLSGVYYISFYRGQNFYNNGLAEQALQYFDQALTQNPEQDDLVSIYSFKGHCLKDLEHYDRAIEVLQAALKIDDERQDIHNILGVCYFKKDEFRLAIDHFHRAVELDPASAMDYANLGVNYKRLGENENAVKYFSLALSLDSDIEFARQQLDELLGN